MNPLVTGALGLGLSAFKYFQGQSQRRQARNMQIYDPGIRANQGLIDNQRILQDRYYNYQLPGYQAMMDQVTTSGANAFSRGLQGATSGGDVQDLATRTQLLEQQGMNQLGIANAQSREQALSDYMGANQALGNDQVRMNMLELDRYNNQLRERAALEQAGATNVYGALNEGIMGLSGIGSYFMPTTTMDASGSVVSGKSPWKMWLDSRNNRNGN